MPRQLHIVLGILLIVAFAATPAVALAQTGTPDAGSANVMVGNFTPNSPLVDIYINGQLLGDNLAFSQATYPAKVRAGSIFIQVFNASTGALIIDGYKDVGANDYYMVPVMNVLERVQFGAYRIPVYEPLATGETRAQFFHAVPQAARLDVLNRTTNIRMVNAIGYVEDPVVVDHLTAGTHNWQVWTNNKTIFPGWITDPNAPPDTLVIDTGNLVLNSGVIYSFFVIGSPTGSPRVMVLALAMPLGGGNPVAPPSASGGGVIGGATPTRTPIGFRPTATRTPTVVPTGVPTNTPVSTAAPTPVVSLSSAALSTNENSNFAISAVLDRPSTSTVTVQYTTSNGTATAPADYTAVTNQTISFAPGVTFQQIVVPIVNDTLDEADETAAVRLSNPSGAVLGSSFQATFTIFDDDPPPTVKISSVTVPIASTPTPVIAITEGQTATVTVTLSAASGRPINVTLQFSGAAPVATNGLDYAANTSVVVIPAGSTSATFTIAVTADGASEPLENLTITLVPDYATPVAGTGLNTATMPLTIPAN